ncbi:MAG: hypothetical protein FWE24_09385 [Defluviitaleaceae bacterium]|nr:hypothetical protein [Defluviitaleaceae bacterium]
MKKYLIYLTLTGACVCLNKFRQTQATFLVAATLFIFTACEGNHYAYTTQVYASPQVQPAPEAAGNPQQAMDFGLHAAEEFLIGYVSLFSLGVYEDGMFFSWSDYWDYSVLLNDTPLVYVKSGVSTNWYNGTAYDRYGNIILDDAPFLRNGLIARDFTLYDIDSNGIPEIFIFYTAETWGSAVLYRFVDGAYQGTLIAWQPRFYTDEDGSTIMASFDYDFVEISYITFTSEGMEFSEPLEMDYAEYERLVASMTQILPLTDMRKDIAASIKQKLDIDYSISTFLLQERTQSEAYYDDDETGAALHPFSAPLLEYFAGGIDVPAYRMIDSTKALTLVLMYQDIAAIPGVLAIRHEAQYGSPLAMGKIFYLYDGELFYKNIGQVDGHPISAAITGDGYPVIIWGELGMRAYTVFAMTNGRLEYHLTLFAEGEVDIWFQVINGGPLGNFQDWESHRYIYEKEFYELLAKFGLDDIRGHWFELEDETEQVLTITY